MKICVLGLGYIGLPTAGMLATHGFEVIGVDINDQVVGTLSNGDVHIKEPGLRTLVQAGLMSGNLRATRKPEHADVFIIAVPTPLRSAPGSIGISDSKRPEDRPSADLSYVATAAESIVSYLRPGNLVILESTVPPRTTTDVLVPILENSGIPSSKDSVIANSFRPQTPDPNGRNLERQDFYSPDDELHSALSTRVNEIYVAHCPERVLPGKILEELVHNDRVIGGVCPTAAQMAKALYTSFVEGSIWLTDATTAELVKLMENTYRDVNIALANEFALVAERVGIDVFEATMLANRHPRVNILEPGPGVGGHCIAVDPWFVIQSASDITSLIQCARKVNDGMPAYVVLQVKKAITAAFGDKPKRDSSQITIACLGLAYKADIDDVRESPALTIIQLLKSEGFTVRVYDPHVPIGMVADQANSLDETVQDADVLLMLTGHKEFRNLGPDELSGFDGEIIIDTRNILPLDQWRSMGMIVMQLGTPGPLSNSDLISVNVDLR